MVPLDLDHLPHPTAMQLESGLMQVQQEKSKEERNKRFTDTLRRRLGPRPCSERRQTHRITAADWIITAEEEPAAATAAAAEAQALEASLRSNPARRRCRLRTKIQTAAAGKSTLGSAVLPPAAVSLRRVIQNVSRVL